MQIRSGLREREQLNTWSNLLSQICAWTGSDTCRVWPVPVYSARLATSHRRQHFRHSLVHSRIRTEPHDRCRGRGRSVGNDSPQGLPQPLRHCHVLESGRRAEAAASPVWAGRGSEAVCRAVECRRRLPGTFKAWSTHVTRLRTVNMNRFNHQRSHARILGLCVVLTRANLDLTNTPLATSGRVCVRCFWSILIVIMLCLGRTWGPAWTGRSNVHATGSNSIQLSDH